MDISEVLIEENNQTNKRLARRRYAGYLSKFSFFFLGILHFTSHYLLSIPFNCVVCIKSNRIQHHHTSCSYRHQPILPTTTSAVSPAQPYNERR